MNEIKKIHTRYQRRKNTPKHLYSYFNPGNLFIVQQRERKLLKLLKTHNISDLSKLQILDVGCGNAAWLREFIKYGAAPKNLFGIDLLDERVKNARIISPNISISQANAENIHFKNRKFNIILQTTIFTSILNNAMRINIAKEMLRLLKNDGLIIWYDFRYNNPNNPDVQGIEKKEIISLFPNCTYSFHKTTLLPPLARILGRISFNACYSLSLFPFLLSHYFVFIKKKI